MCTVRCLNALIEWAMDCGACTEGPMSAEAPKSAADLKLILGGKFLDNGEVINGEMSLSCACQLAVSVSVL